LLTAVFKNIHVNNWIELLQHVEPITFTPIFERVANKKDVYTINHVLEILKSLSLLSSPSLDSFFQNHINNIPSYLATIQLSKLKDVAGDENVTRKDTIKSILKKVIELSHYKEKDTDWIKDTVEVITNSLSRNYVNSVLVVIVSNEKGVLAKKILQICISNLVDRTAVKPTPPSDWKRSMPDTKNDIEIWNILKPFLESADTQFFEYKKGQSYRSQMESAIARVTIDLKMETIKKSSPHVLKITKTQAAYKRALKNWEEDVAILQNLR